MIKKSELLEKLKVFAEKLEKHRAVYAHFLNTRSPLTYPNSRVDSIENVPEIKEQKKELHRLFAVLEPYINNYSLGRIKVLPKTGGRKWDIYTEAIGNHISRVKRASLDAAILDLEGIIAKVEFEAKEEIAIIEDKNYLKLFDLMQLHPIIIEVSSQRFKKAQYSDAIREAFKAVENYVKEKSGKDDFGSSLMSKVFRFEYDEKKKELKRPPILQLSKLETKSERSEQQGYMYIFMGTMEGIRNPFAHEPIEINDPILTLKYLCFASHLLEKLDIALNKGIKKTK